MRKTLQSTALSGSEAAPKNINFREDNLKGWTDCYSSTIRAQIDCIEVRDGLEVKTGSEESQIVAVGGNFRAFHPFRFLSGGFLPETPVDTYQIVINDVLAWKFYRSYDVTGNRLIINGKMFTIIGVVEEKNTKVAELAGEQEYRAFIYFGAMESLFSNESGSTGGDDEYGDPGYSTGIGDGYVDYAVQCYEAMLPELVKGVAITDFKNAIPNYSVLNPQVYVVNNTGRFRVNRIFDTVFPLGESVKERLGYEFPYWEIAAQLTEQRLLYDYILIGIGLLLIFIGCVMIALKFRAKRAVKPEELDDEEEEDVLETDTKDLLLR